MHLLRLILGGLLGIAGAVLALSGLLALAGECYFLFWKPYGTSFTITLAGSTTPLDPLWRFVLSGAVAALGLALCYAAYLICSATRREDSP